MTRSKVSSFNIFNATQVLVMNIIHQFVNVERTFLLQIENKDWMLSGLSKDFDNG